MTAESCHRRAFEVGDDKDEALLNLGYVLRAQRRYGEAIEAFEQALQISPDYPQAKVALDGLVGIADLMETARSVEARFS